MYWIAFGTATGFEFRYIFMVALWALFISGIVYFTKIAAAGVMIGRSEEPMSNILKRRYAHEEISMEELDGMKRDLLRR